MDRRVTPPRQVTSPTWGPPPPCKQARKNKNNTPNWWTYFEFHAEKFYGATSEINRTNFGFASRKYYYKIYSFIARESFLINLRCWFQIRYSSFEHIENLSTWKQLNLFNSNLFNALSVNISIIFKRPDLIRWNLLNSKAISRISRVLLQKLYKGIFPRQRRLPCHVHYFKLPSLGQPTEKIVRPQGGMSPFESSEY